MFGIKECMLSKQDAEQEQLEFWSNNLECYALRCDTDAKEKKQIYLQWCKSVTESFSILYLENKHDNWLRARDSVQFFLIKLYYYYGAILKNLGWPIEKLSSISEETLLSFPEYRELIGQYHIEEKKVLSDSNVDKELLRKYLELQGNMRNSMYLAVSKIGYYFTEMENKKIHDFASVLGLL